MTTRPLIAFLGFGLLVLIVFINQRVAAQSYEPYIQILEGSVKCRQGIFGSPGGPMLSYEAWMTDPGSNTIATHDKFSYSYRLDGEYSVEPAVNGTYTCYARLYVDGTQIAYLQESKYVVVQTPTSLNKYHEAYVSGGCGVPAHYWKVRDYQVLDQQSPPQPIYKVMGVNETMSVGTNTCGANFVTGPTSTTSSGTFRDNYYLCNVPACGGGSCQIAASQELRADGHVVGNYSLNYTCFGVTVTP